MLSKKSLLTSVCGTGIFLYFLFFVYGAVPFVAVPAGDQAVWTAGYAQSYANNDLFSIKANNVGHPAPAAIAFGLAGAWPTSIFIRLGLPPLEAYSTMVAMWLLIVFIGTYKLARLFGISSIAALFAGATWLSMPIAWAHSGYSMVSLGLALIPLYLGAAIILFEGLDKQSTHQKYIYFIYPLICILAVFMDGYSFVMFAAGSGLIGAYVFLRCKEKRKSILSKAVPTCGLGLLTAYLLYSKFIGATSFPPSGLPVFRGWGVDLSFISIPTQGWHVFPDLLGLSIPRNASMWFGDSSVYKTSFCLPILLTAIIGWWITRKKTILASALIIVTLFGLYMSLGPSLKCNSTRPAYTQARGMAPEYAIAPTGSGIISKHVPGFNVMRASYRWLGLAVAGSWLLLILFLATNERDKQKVAITLLTIILLLNLPSPTKTLKNQNLVRKRILDTYCTILPLLRQDLHPGEIVAFLPYGNDFGIMGIAPELGIHAFNIGGDKNFEMAFEHWPKELQTLTHTRSPRSNNHWVNGAHLLLTDPRAFSKNIITLLADKKTNTIVLPYFNLCRVASGTLVPVEYKMELIRIIEWLEKSGLVTLKKREHYAIVQSNQTLENLKKEKELTAYIKSLPPLLAIISKNISTGYGAKGTEFLTSGWSSPERWGTWSNDIKSAITIPVGKNSVLLTLRGIMHVNDKVKRQRVRIVINGKLVQETIFSTHQASFSLHIPKKNLQDNAKHNLSISLEFPDATSPRNVGKSGDSRLLAFGIQSITIYEEPHEDINQN